MYLASIGRTPPWVAMPRLTHYPACDETRTKLELLSMQDQAKGHKGPRSPLKYEEGMPKQAVSEMKLNVIEL